MNYETFLASKIKNDVPAGIAEGVNLSEKLFDFQADIVRWALRRGRAAIFADCGLGKSAMQLQWAQQVQRYTDKPVLILAPVAVSEQTVREGLKFDVAVSRVDHGGEITPISVTNYERLHLFDASVFGGVVIDESSILKSFTGKIRNQIIAEFADTPFKLACTATPSPNDHTELGNHAEFLGVMSMQEMLATYFVHDASNAASEGWRLKGHAVEEFWRWVASWAVSIKTPSDLGYSDEGYILPSLNIIDHTVDVDHTDNDTDMLFRMPASTMGELRKEERMTVQQRCERVAELVSVSDEPWIIWCHRNDESALLADLIPGAVEITGSDTNEDKARRMIAFSDGDIRVLITKPSIAGFGMNWQHCRNVAFVGLTHSYEQFYQAVRRCWRFGQTHAVDCHVVIAETQTKVLQAIKRKQTDAEIMNSEMVKAMRTVNIAAVRGELVRESIDHTTDIARGDGWTLHLGDCVDVVSDIETGTIDGSIYSPPFSSLFTYSNSPRDMGNCSDDEEFFQHYEFLIGELLRVTKPGRLSMVHCMDLTATKSREGYIGLRDFPGDIIRAHQAAGWIWHSKVTIWKDPVTAMQRTKAHGLLYKTLRKDSTRSRQGLADYLLVFRKPGDNPRPVGHTPEDFPLDDWQDYASPVWANIDQTNVLSNFRDAREERDERHMCPLQLDLIERALRLWTAKDDLILSPFAGIGSEGYQSLKMGRRFIGSELKPSYWRQACFNLERASGPSPQINIFEVAQ
jgi:superfamily II DNA or RNA helicase